MRLIESPGSVRVHVPMELRRRSGRKQIVLPDEDVQPDGTQPLPADPVDPRDTVVLTLARAFRWKRLLDEGKFTSIAEMAEALGINRWYLSRMIRLTLLSPRIVDGIVHGTRQDATSVEKLRGPMPLLWGDQEGLTTNAA